MPTYLTARVTWIGLSGVVCSLAQLGVLGWEHLTAMMVGALMMRDDY